MTIPSKDDFLTFIYFALRNRPENTFMPSSWADSLPSRDELTDFLINFYRGKQAAMEAKRQLPVGIWLYGQPIFRKALQISIGRKKQAPISIEEYASRQATLMLEPKSHAHDRPANMPHISSYSIDSRWADNSFDTDVSSALLEYFHTVNFKHSIELRPKLVKAHEKVLRAMDELIEMVQTIADEKSDISPHSASAILASLESRSRMLHRVNVVPADLRNPITRNDPTAREQLFVYRLWQSNRRFGGISSAVASELMFIEGIEHQYDLRTVERLYSKFTDQKRRENAETRRGTKTLQP